MKPLERWEVKHLHGNQRVQLLWFNYQNTSGIVTFPCYSQCTRCCHAEWGSLVPPGRWSTACRWNTRYATDAPQRRCTWPLPDLHTSEILQACIASLSKNIKTKPKTWLLTGDWLGAANTFLGIQVAEAFKAIGVVFPSCEALPWQLLPTADAQETLAMPGFLLIGHPSCCDGLEMTKMTRMNLACFTCLVWSFTYNERLHWRMSPLPYLLTSAALVCILFLKTGNAEVAWILWDEWLGSYWLLAPVAQEAGLMPAVPLVFHFAGTWFRGQGRLMQYNMF